MYLWKSQIIVQTIFFTILFPNSLSAKWICGVLVIVYPFILDFTGQILKLLSICLILKLCISWAVKVTCTENVLIITENFRLQIISFCIIHLIFTRNLCHKQSNIMMSNMWCPCTRSEELRLGVKHFFFLSLSFFNNLQLHILQTQGEQLY